MTGEVLIMRRIWIRVRVSHVLGGLRGGYWLKSHFEKG